MIHPAGPAPAFVRRSAPAFLLLFAFALLGPPRLGAQSSPLADRALKAFTSQAWAEALPLFEELAKAQPQDALAHLRLGVVRLHLGQGRAGLSSIETARELGGAPLPQVEFRLACAHAVLDDKPAAFAALDRALTAGFFNLSVLQSEPLLAPLRSAPEYAAIVARIDRGLNPCKHDPKYREFDYWLGTWDVTPAGTPPGTPGGVNIITLEYGDCIVHEHWTGASGFSGESFNLWDASRGAWFQTWVDSTGGMHEYKGGLDAQGNMALTGELSPSPGQGANANGRVSTRLTFLKLGPDSIRQLSEQSTDGGKSWQIAYDLIYTRRKQ